MSVQSEIDRIKGNVAGAYAAVGGMGGTLPLEQNSGNLAEAISSIPAGGGIPAGAIVIWSGPESGVPAGWALCDGTNGTPDLRGRFVLAAGDGHELGETGGAEEVALTVEQMPEHNHRIEIGYNGQPIQGTSSGNRSCFSAVGKMPTTTAGASQPHPNMPPFYVLAYIMKL